jgi:hypothetical protein
MADLGVITTLSAALKRLPADVPSGKLMNLSFGVQPRKLIGFVDGLATDYRLVNVIAFTRAGRAAASCHPDITGAFSMYVDSVPADYFVVATSPDGSAYNAVIADRVASTV